MSACPMNAPSVTLAISAEGKARVQAGCASLQACAHGSENGGEPAIAGSRATMADAAIASKRP